MYGGDLAPNGVLRVDEGGRVPRKIVWGRHPHTIKPDTRVAMLEKKIAPTKLMVGVL